MPIDPNEVTNRTRNVCRRPALDAFPWGMESAEVGGDFRWENGNAREDSMQTQNKTKNRRRGVRLGTNILKPDNTRRRPVLDPGPWENAHSVKCCKRPHTGKHTCHRERHPKTTYQQFADVTHVNSDGPS